MQSELTSTIAKKSLCVLKNIYDKRVIYTYFILHSKFPLSVIEIEVQLRAIKFGQFSAKCAMPFLELTEKADTLNKNNCLPQHIKQFP